MILFLSFRQLSSFFYAQCISQDIKRGMFNGIAVDFLMYFPILESLRSVELEGSLRKAVPVQHGPIFIYNLIKKNYYFAKPTLEMIRNCLLSMHNHAMKNLIYLFQVESK